MKTKHPAVSKGVYPCAWNASVGHPPRRGAPQQLAGFAGVRLRRLIQPSRDQADGRNFIGRVSLQRGKVNEKTRGDLVNSVALTPALAPCSMKEPVSKRGMSKGSEERCTACFTSVGCRRERRHPDCTYTDQVHPFNGVNVTMSLLGEK